jgi:hypothetical protein
MVQAPWRPRHATHDIWKPALEPGRTSENIRRGLGALGTLSGCQGKRVKGGVIIVGNRELNGQPVTQAGRFDFRCQD